ncbi:MAG: hypothetical protein ABGZ24_30715 [Fuerstiella sp.]
MGFAYNRRHVRVMSDGHSFGWSAIAATEFDAAELERSWLHADCDEYLEKPLSRDDPIRAVLRDTTLKREAVLMNAEAMTVSTANETVETRQRKVPWVVLPVLTVVWLGMVGIGLSSMWEYETTPGQLTAPLAHWPDDSLMECSPDRPTLVVFAHPRCPCTRATIGELAVIMAHCPERVDVRVLFVRPSVFSAGWEKTDLWSAAEAIPGVKVLCDEDGFEAIRFRATTSGYSLLYDPTGRFLFSGGITGSRGHSGDNAGRSAIESLVMTGASVGKRHLCAFGCPLLGRDDTYVAKHQEGLR